MLLTWIVDRQPANVHRGKVSTLQRKQRWCSDGFEIACGNGEKVHVIFVPVTCDREMMAFSATTGGYNVNMAQSVMLACVEKRFGNVKTLQPVEWLSDNGSCYTARETITFTVALGIFSKYIPARSPNAPIRLNFSSKTFKRLRLL